MNIRLECLPSLLGHFYLSQDPQWSVLDYQMQNLYLHLESWWLNPHKHHTSYTKDMIYLDYSASYSCLSPKRLNWVNKRSSLKQTSQRSFRSPVERTRSRLFIILFIRCWPVLNLITASFLRTSDWWADKEDTVFKISFNRKNIWKPSMEFRSKTSRKKTRMMNVIHSEKVW